MLTILAAMLLGLPDNYDYETEARNFKQAVERNKPRDFAKGYMLALHPGKQVEITISHESSAENNIYVMDQRDVKVLEHQNNYHDGRIRDTRRPSLLSKVKIINTSTDKIQILSFISQNKDIDPSQTKSLSKHSNWEFSPHRVWDDGKGHILIGWNDRGDDSDFNDIMVDLKISDIEKKK